ncbi:MAG: hypothetical protein MHMPM18_003736 [Marteilia pararefringens]
MATTGTNVYQPTSADKILTALRLLFASVAIICGLSIIFVAYDDLKQVSQISLIVACLLNFAVLILNSIYAYCLFRGKKYVEIILRYKCKMFFIDLVSIVLIAAAMAIVLIIDRNQLLTDQDGSSEQILTISQLVCVAILLILFVINSACLGFHIHQASEESKAPEASTASTAPKEPNSEI